MKQTKLFLSLLMLVVFGIGNVWGAEYTTVYTLASTDNGKSVTKDGVQWAMGNDAITASSNNSTKLTGFITLTLPKGATLIKVELTKSNQWGTGAKVIFASNDITLNEFTNSGVFNLTTNKTELVYTFTKGGTSSKNAWVKEIKITYEISVQKPSVSLTPQEMTLNVGDASKEISATIENYTGNLSWTCSSEGIIKLISGADTKTATIEPIAEGTCDVTASFTVEGTTYSGSCHVIVAPAVSRYTITYETNGGTAVEKSEQQTNLPSTFPTTMKAGYNFYGWYVDADCKTLAEAGAPLTDNVTLYAKWEEPYEVSYAWSLIDEGLAEKDVNVYVKGYVSAIDDVSGIEKYGNITYTISDDSKTLTVFRGYNLNNEKFTSTDKLHLGDVVVVYGKLVNYKSKYEIDASNYIYSRTEAVAHNITLLQDADAYGTIDVDKTAAKLGEIVNLTATPASHCKFTDWMVSVKGSSKNITVTDNTFIMPNADVEVMGGFEELPKYTISLAVAKNGETACGTVYFENTTDDILEWYADEEPKIIAKSADKDAYIFEKWEVTSGTATIADPTSANTTLQLSADAEITAYFIPKPVAATITLWENGVENPSKLNGNVGEAITLPTTAGGNCNKSVAFVGWSEVEIANSANAPADKFYAPGTVYTIQQENTTLYAVYAKDLKQVFLSEDFSELTTGNLDNQGSLWNGNANFTANTAYPAGGVVKLGGKSSTGSLKSKVLTIAAGNTINVSFDVLGWTTVEGNIKVTVAGTGNQTITYKATKSDKFESKSVDFVLTKENPTITIETTAKRAFIDNVIVSAKGYSDYSTTCAEAVEVAMPTFSVAGGEYTEAQSVEISCATAGAIIYYTFDGTEPTSASNKYSGAINVDKSMFIKAIAYIGTDNYSDVATAEYVVLQAQTIKVTNGDNEEFTEATIYADGEGNALTAYIDYNSTGAVTVTADDETLVDITTNDMYGTLVVSLVAKGKAGTTTITVNVAKDETYVSGSASFVLHVIEHKTIVSMSFAAASYEATLGEEFTAPTLTVSPSVVPIVYSSSDENAAKVDATTGEITLVGMGTTTITATYAGDETHDPATAQYTLNVTDPNADIIDVAFTGAEYISSISYIDWEKEGNTHTIYKGNSAQSEPKNGSGIQIRSSNSTSGIVSTVSKGFIKSVSITFAKENTNGIDIYANLTPYKSAADLYDGGTSGVKLTSLKGLADETVTFVPTANYPYIGIRSNKNAAYIKQIAIAWTPTEVVRMGLTEGKFGTICLEKSVTTSLGASFYEIAYREDQNGEPYKVLFDEVKTLEAGVPYIFLAEDEQITVVYGDETAIVAGSRNGLVGTFAAIQDGAAGTAGNTLENNYLVNNNQIRKCGGNCSLPANRAYIRMGDVSTLQTAPQPGRRRVTLQNAATGTATGWEGITEDCTVAPIQEGIYDVLGRKLENAESGFYIINGKKQVIVK